MVVAGGGLAANLCWESRLERAVQSASNPFLLKAASFLEGGAAVEGVVTAGGGGGGGGGLAEVPDTSWESRFERADQSASNPFLVPAPEAVSAFISSTLGRGDAPQSEPAKPV